ncbi:dharma [Trachinotus anak]|uniref:dharma n=1 Tax=Trachinotus anak TaxID=443729 RepID=UPI0039F2357E
MAGSRVSDFSIERILSPQLGHKSPVMEFPPDGYLQEMPGGFCLDSGSHRPPAPVPVPAPVPGCLQCQGMNFAEVLCPYGAGFHRTDFSSIYFSGRDPADAQQLPSYHGYHPAGASAQPQPQPQPRQRARMRTVFTGSQAAQLEALFELTDYPGPEARAAAASSTGLSEETVRVWFKNRRARRKRQCSGSKVKCPSPPPYSGEEKRTFTSFL